MDNSKQAYSDKIHLLGRTSIAIALLLFFSVPMVIILVYKIEVDIKALITATIPVAMLFAPIAIAELISYYPILGAGASYVSFITGNVTNMKIPATLSGMSIVDAEPGSEEGQIIAVLASGTSSIVTTLILFMGLMFLSNFIAPILQDPVWKPAFDNLMPALFGAIAIGYFIKDFKISILPFILVTIIAAVLGLQKFGLARSYILVVCMVLTCVQSYFMYKSGFLTPKKK